jgi:hypothetical protein
MLDSLLACPEPQPISSQMLSTDPGDNSVGKLRGASFSPAKQAPLSVCAIFRQIDNPLSRNDISPALA